MTRQKVTLHMNSEVLAMVRQLAESEGISVAGAMDRVALEGLQRIADGAIDFDGYLQPSAGGRYPWTVEIESDGLQVALAERLTIT